MSDSENEEFYIDQYGNVHDPSKGIETYERELKCEKCNKIFPSKTGLLNHMRMHLTVRKLKCALCEEEFDTNKELVAHKEQHANEKRSFLCTKCNVAFTDHCDWLIHNLKHMKRSSYKCEECHKTYKLKSVFQCHIMMHYNKNLHCDLCSETFSTHLKLNNHIMNVHENSYDCCECGLKCKNKKSLDYHMMQHTGFKPYQCHYCGQGFASKAIRKRHHLSHSGELPYGCEKCGRRFKDSGTVKTHPCKAIETSKNFVCDVCSKRFLNKTSLVPHMKLHTGDFKYKCVQCNVKFVSISSLRAHMIYKHTTDTPYVCSFEGCNKGFKTKQAMQRHENVHKKL